MPNQEWNELGREERIYNLNKIKPTGSWERKQRWPDLRPRAREEYEEFWFKDDNSEERKKERKKKRCSRTKKVLAFIRSNGPVSPNEISNAIGNGRRDWAKYGLKTLVKEGKIQKIEKGIYEAVVK